MVDCAPSASQEKVIESPARAIDAEIVDDRKRARELTGGATIILTRASIARIGSGQIGVDQL